MKQLLLKGFFCSLIAVSGMIMAMPDVQVQGLFSGRAVLNIDGNVRMLKEGDVSPEGVKLVKADSDTATLVIEGETRVLSLSGRIGASYEAPSQTIVRLKPDRGGHYVTRAVINGRSAQVLLDTGATLVAMNSRHAMDLGISLEGARDSYSSTASGLVATKIVTLNSVSIGGITRNAVPAAIIEGDFPRTILLGNSYLSGVDMKVESGVMILQAKF